MVLCCFGRRVAHPGRKKGNRTRRRRRRFVALTTVRFPYPLVMTSLWFQLKSNTPNDFSARLDGQNVTFSHSSQNTPSGSYTRPLPCALPTLLSSSSIRRRWQLVAAPCSRAAGGRAPATTSPALRMQLLHKKTRENRQLLHNTAPPWPALRFVIPAAACIRSPTKHKNQPQTCNTFSRRTPTMTSYLIDPTPSARIGTRASGGARTSACPATAATSTACSPREFSKSTGTGATSPTTQRQCSSGGRAG